MIETILISMLILKTKGYKIKPMFKVWAFYPMLIFTLIYVLFNIIIFHGYYGFVKYSRLLEMAYLSTFLFLIIKYKLYGSAVVGSIAIFIGTALNRLAIYANGGYMPVFPTLSYITHYVKPDSFSIVNDIHILGSEDTKLKILTDYIDIGYSILSVGDIFIRFFTFIIIYAAIKHINEGKMKDIIV